MLQYLVKVGSDAKGTPHPKLGSVLQPQAAKGTTPEGSVSISGWTTTEGTYGDGTPFTLRKPEYKFTGVVPEFYSIRLAISKPIGMGLLEAVDENDDRRSGRYERRPHEPGHRSGERPGAHGPLRLESQSRPA